MPELVGLAVTVLPSASEGKRLRLMAQTLGLSRVEASARAGLERASVLGRQSMELVAAADQSTTP